MDADLRDTMKKQAWLELYVPIDGTSRRLAEKLIRRGVRKTVTQPDPNKTMPENMEHKPMEAPTVPPEQFQHKIANFKARYERS